MPTTNDFYAYARLSKGMKNKMTHRGIVVVTEGTGAPGDDDYVPMDATVGLISPIITYPKDHETYDLPGKIGGPNLTYDNSLTMSVNPEPIAAPIATVFSIPAHVIASPEITQIDFTGMKTVDISEDGTATVLLSTKLGVIDETLITFEYWNGSAYVTLAGDERYDGIAYTFDVTLPAVNYGLVKWRTTFDSGVDEGEYSFNAMLFRILPEIPANPPSGTFYEGDVLVSEFVPEVKTRKLLDVRGSFDVSA